MQVFSLIPIHDNVEVVCTAFNEETASAELRGASSFMVGGVATFEDLRFFGRSGRGV